MKIHNGCRAFVPFVKPFVLQKFPCRGCGLHEVLFIFFFILIFLCFGVNVTMST